MFPLRHKWAAALTLVPIVVMAATPTAKPASESMATVNGVGISVIEFNRAMDVAIARGQQDTPVLRTAIRDELVLRELLNQEAKRSGIDKEAATQMDLGGARANVLVERMVAADLAAKPVTDDELRQEYARQIKLLGSATTVEQLQLSQIAVATEDKAMAVLARLKAGADFATVARDVSIDASRANGGAIGWLLPHQIVPAVGGAVAGLAKGAYTVSPIHVGDVWNVIRVDDRRPFPIPAFEESHAQLMTAVLQARRVRLLDRLVKSSTITLSN